MYCLYRTLCNPRIGISNLSLTLTQMGKVQTARLGGTQKGKRVIQTTNRAQKKANKESLAKATAAAALAKRLAAQHKADPSFMSPATTTSRTTMESVGSTISNITDLSSPEEDKLTGVSYYEFIEQRYDFRKWGSLTYHDFVHDGHQQNLLDLLSNYDVAVKKKKDIAHQYIVSLDELPLNETSTITVSRMALAVAHMIRRITYKDVMSLSAEIAEFVQYSSREVRVWTAQFMHNEGYFCNVGYSKREPAGIINDPVAVQTMCTWMYNASIGPQLCSA